MSSLLKVLCVLLTILSIQSNKIYMSTSGDDYSGNGSESRPYRTLMKCQEVANPGDEVIIRGGTYTNFAIAASDNVYNYVFKFTKSGVTYRGNTNEKVVFDFEFNSKYKMKNNKATQRVAAFFIAKNVKDITPSLFSISTN